MQKGMYPVPRIFSERDPHVEVRSGRGVIGCPLIFIGETKFLFVDVDASSALNPERGWVYRFDR
jgi:hypothetical protein